ncbi:MAG: (2Fe-2S)-binding protein [Deltaproteobacteria bacterium]|nr:(2Fe-2S)-binding protein [Deltaproteobacteria bacterium]
MGKEITISIDNRGIQSREGISILEAADQAGIYIPRLCHYPDLQPGPGTKSENLVYRGGRPCANDSTPDSHYKGCNICIVEIEGRGCCPSCATVVEDGMVIHSDDAAVRKLRIESLMRIIALHPHACLLCAEKEGCDRQECTQGTEKHERCCPKFDFCELRKVSEYVTIRDDVSKYFFRDIPAANTAFFTINANFCIGCTRCVRACEKTAGKRVIGFVYRSGEFIHGTLGTSYKESGCVLCGACVEVCPTGALMDKGLPWKKKERLNFAPVILPPQDCCECTEENIEKVPEDSGIYELIDEKHAVILIRGASDVRQDLREMLKTVGKARFFRYEEHSMYTMRETEMLEKYLKKYGKLPEVNDEISDLY